MTGKRSWLNPIKDIQDISKWNYGKRKTFSLINDISKEIQQQYKDKVLSYLREIKKDGNQHKLRTYGHLKTTYNIEPYLLKNLPWTFRSKVTSLRIGSHSLEIERGRYQKPQVKLENRICKFCLPQKYIGDEFHFMMKCSLFSQRRKDLLSELKIYEPSNNEDALSNFITILTTKVNDDDSCLIIGKYIYEGFKLHVEMMNRTPSD